MGVSKSKASTQESPVKNKLQSRDPRDSRALIEGEWWTESEDEDTHSDGFWQLSPGLGGGSLHRGGGGFHPPDSWKGDGSEYDGEGIRTRTAAEKARNNSGRLNRDEQDSENAELRRRIKRLQMETDQIRGEKADLEKMLEELAIAFSSLEENLQAPSPRSNAGTNNDNAASNNHHDDVDDDDDEDDDNPPPHTTFPPTLETPTAGPPDIHLEAPPGPPQPFRIVPVASDGNCFWRAFSELYYHTPTLWARTKLRTHAHFSRVISDGQHPRHDLYTRLAHLAALDAFPLDEQLARPNAWTSEQATQLVADLFDVQLVVHYAQPAARGAWHSGVLVRGPRNRRQVFMTLVGVHWQGLRPCGVPESEYRFESDVMRNAQARLPVPDEGGAMGVPPAVVPRPRVGGWDREGEAKFLRLGEEAEVAEVVGLGGDGESELMKLAREALAGEGESELMRLAREVLAGEGEQG
ncbi:hypothetical protein FGG08_006267 [Glutinoglossum americanum]|uniref:OTU domain-containing protein n=1 Tax=Glutinoglossum americanum TaxID=1670608 RepID=A0A9P8HWP6_9PEZI|nr:hypothetical protein FGG08_006267 [Glutinoglossum americanum]